MTSPFQIPEFKFFLTTRVANTIGGQLKSVIIGYYLYELTKDPLMIGVLGLCEALPFIALALYAGYFVESRVKQRILKLVFGFVTFNTLFLALLPILHFLKILSTEQTVFSIFTLIVMRGISLAFAPPAMASAMSQMISKVLMPKAAAINSTAWQIGAVLGPLLGASLAFFPSGLDTDKIVFYLMIVAFFFHLVAWIGLLQIKDVPSIIVKSSKEPMMIQIREGINYVFTNKIMLYAISLDLFAVFFGGVTALLPVFAKDILHTDLTGLSWLRAALPFGAAVMMLWLSFYPPVKKSGYKLLFAVGLYGVSTIAFAFSTNIYFSFAMLFLCGVFDSVSVVIRATILQLQTPEDMKSRVTAVNSMFISSSNELGAAESGFAARLMGTIPSVVFGGTMTMLVVGWVWVKGKVLKESEMV
jgi:MFS family permease